MSGIPSTDTGGVKPMSITGRMVRERERCIGMTPEERAWRAQWLKDQILTKREPVYVKELEMEFRNPIRRVYLWPLDKLLLEPLIPKIVNILINHVLLNSRYVMQREHQLHITSFVYYMEQIQLT